MRWRHLWGGCRLSQNAKQGRNWGVLEIEILLLKVEFMLPKMERVFQKWNVIRGVYSHPPGNGSSGGICLGGVIALDVDHAGRLKHLWGVKIAY